MEPARVMMTALLIVGGAFLGSVLGTITGIAVAPAFRLWLFNRLGR